MGTMHNARPSPPESEDTTMPVGPEGQKRPADLVGCAVTVARIATGEQRDSVPKHPGKRKGGLAGARARAVSIGPETRQESARKAAKARWDTKGGGA